MPRKKVHPEDTTVKEQPNREYAAVTIHNIDPAMLYSIDTGGGHRGIGFVVRFSHDPKTSERIAPGQEVRRFFVCEPGGDYQQYTMPVDEAIGAKIKHEGRVDKKHTEAFNQWMSVNYVKPQQ